MPCRLVLTVLILFLLAGCKQNKETYQESYYVFGTIVEIIIDDEDQEKSRAAAAEIGSFFQTLHTDWHAWKKGGELFELNRSIAQGRAHMVSDKLAQAILQAKSFYSDSSGTFDPAIGRAIKLWGFHQDSPPTGPEPRGEDINALLQSHPSMADVTVQGNLVSATNKDVALDLGGFAKGAAIDLAIKRLRQHGVTSAIVNAGGDLNVLGQNKTRPWRIAVRDPMGWGAIGVIEARSGEAVYTSGNYERYLKQNGTRLSHIIDPRTFRPVRNIVSATVISNNGARADAAATALSVAGKDKWRDVAKAMDITLALLITEEGTVLMTPRMQERIVFTAARYSSNAVATRQ